MPRNVTHPGRQRKLAGEILLFLLVPALFVPITWGPTPFWDLSHKVLGNFLEDSLSFTWILHQFGENLLSLGNQPLFDGKIFFPSTESLLGSECLPCVSLIYRFFWTLSHDKLLSLNLTLFFLLFLNYGVAYLCARQFLGRVPSLFAAYLFAFAVMRVGRLKHVHLMPQFLYPVALLLVAWIVRDQKRWLYLLLGLCVSFQFYWSITLGLILFMTLIPVLALIVLWHFPRHVKGGLLFCLGLLFTLPIAISYATYAWRTRTQSDVREAIAYSANIKSYFVVPREHPYAKPIVDGVFGGEPGNREEKMLFVGFCALLLAYWGLRELWRRVGFPILGRRLVVCVGIWVVWLSLGCNGLLYQALYYTFPPMRALRTPGRFGLMYLLLVAALAGVGLAHLHQTGWKTRKKAKLALLLLILFLGDQWYTPASTPFEFSIPRPVAILQQTVDREPLAFAPYNAFGETVQMLSVLDHQHPIVGGWARFVPPEAQHWESLLRRVALGEEAALQDLRRQKVGYLIFQKGGTLPPSLSPRTALYEDGILYLFRL